LIEMRPDHGGSGRLKIWRAEMARTLVFGSNGDVQPPMTPDPDTTTGKSSWEHPQMRQYGFSSCLSRGSYFASIS